MRSIVLTILFVLIIHVPPTDTILLQIDPDVEELLIPAPEFATYDETLTAEHRRITEWLGEAAHTREVMTSGLRIKYESTNHRMYVYITDRTIGEVRDAYIRMFRERGIPVGGYGDMNTGEIEEAGLGFDHEPEQFQHMMDEYGLDFNREYLEWYREAFPRLRGATIQEVEFLAYDSPGGSREPPATYREVVIRITHPAFDPARITLNDRTAIIYTIFDMNRTVQ